MSGIDEEEEDRPKSAIAWGSSDSTTSSRLDVLAHSTRSRGEDAEHNLVPQVQTLSWPLVSMPVVLPQLRAEIYEVKHSTETSRPLLTSQAHLALRRALDELQDC